MSLTPKVHSPQTKEFFPDSNENLLGEITVKPPTSPGYLTVCLQTCLLGPGALSREEKTCLNDCYSKSSFHRPQRIVL